MKNILTIHCTIAPTAKAIHTDNNIPDIIANAFSELMYDIKVPIDSPDAIILKSDTATAAHNNSNTIETVVDVGSLNVLYTSSKMTSVIITAKKMTIISAKTN